MQTLSLPQHCLTDPWRVSGRYPPHIIPSPLAAPQQHQAADSAVGSGVIGRVVPLTHHPIHHKEEKQCANDIVPGDTQSLHTVGIPNRM